MSASIDSCFNRWVTPSRFCRRWQVRQANDKRLAALPGDEVVFYAGHGGVLPQCKTREKLLADILVPPTLRLKVNAQVSQNACRAGCDVAFKVMLARNIDNGLVNGSVG